jgi:hypothetical protein
VPKAKNKKNPGFVCRGIWHFKMPRGRQFEYAPEKLSKSPGWGEPGSLLGCIGWDGGIAAYANNQHRRIVDAKEY